MAERSTIKYPCCKVKMTIKASSTLGQSPTKPASPLTSNKQENAEDTTPNKATPGSITNLAEEETAADQPALTPITEPIASTSNQTLLKLPSLYLTVMDAHECTEAAHKRDAEARVQKQWTEQWVEKVKEEYLAANHKRTQERAEAEHKSIESRD